MKKKCRENQILIINLGILKKYNRVKIILCRIVFQLLQSIPYTNAIIVYRSLIILCKDEVKEIRKIW